jgi:hypothetical protein
MNAAIEAMEPEGSFRRIEGRKKTTYPTPTDVMAASQEVGSMHNCTTHRKPWMIVQFTLEVVRTEDKVK